MFRVRLSCCQGLIDLFKTPNIPISYIDIAPELWKQLFRVMDDIHAGTRLAAENATRIFSRVKKLNHNLANFAVLSQVSPNDDTLKLERKIMKKVWYIRE